MRRRRLVIFLKAPRFGAVKTRLARDIGALAAWRFYRANSARTIRRLADPRWELVLSITPDRTKVGLPAAVVVGQGRGDLGARMARALGATRPTVLVGSDIPALQKRHVARAFGALAAGADLVFGPAEDGGFWLVGVRARPPRGLFAGARWSTAHALADVLAKAPPRTRIAFIETLADVDDGAAYRAQRAGSSASLPTTSRAATRSSASAKRSSGSAPAMRGRIRPSS
jgi:rSAM/selenodomain-associated transferase 1